MYENIEINKGYKYPELCELLGETQKSGNSKIAQVKEWSKYFEIDRTDPKRFVIKKVYDEKTQFNNLMKTDLTNYLVCLIVKWLAEESKNGNTEPIKTRRQILRDFWLVNDEYYKNKDNVNSLATELKMSAIFDDSDKTTEIENWYKISGKMFSNLIERVISKLRNGRLATVNNGWRLYKKIQDGFSGTDVIISHDCTDDEIKLVDGLQREIIEAMGFNDMQQIYRNEATYNFFKRAVNRRLKEETGYDNFGRTYKFLINECFHEYNVSLPEYNKMVVKHFLECNGMKQIKATVNEFMVDKTIDV